MNWQKIKSEFDHNESLLDLYIQQTNADDWQRALDLIRSGPYRLCYLRDGQETPLPTDANEMLAARQEANTLLRVDAGGITINCHFFIEEQIEFDVYLPEINTEARFDSLCQFMRLIGQGLNKSVDLTPENTEEQIILKYIPEQDEYQYRPDGMPSWRGLAT